MSNTAVRRIFEVGGGFQLERGPRGGSGQRRRLITLLAEKGVLRPLALRMKAKYGAVTPLIALMCEFGILKLHQVKGAICTSNFGPVGL